MPRGRGDRASASIQAAPCLRSSTRGSGCAPPASRPYARRRLRAACRFGRLGHRDDRRLRTKSRADPGRTAAHRTPAAAGTSGPAPAADCDLEARRAPGLLRETVLAPGAADRDRRAEPPAYKPPRTEAEAQRLAAEQSAFCDECGIGLLDIPVIAEQLQISPIRRFWAGLAADRLSLTSSTGPPCTSRRESQQDGTARSSAMGPCGRQPPMISEQVADSRASPPRGPSRRVCSPMLKERNPLLNLPDDPHGDSGSLYCLARSR